MRLGKLAEGPRLRAVKKIFENNSVPEPALLSGVRTDAAVAEIPGFPGKCLLQAQGADPDALMEACNLVYAGGGVPECAEITIFLPPQMTEQELKKITRSLEQEAGRLNVRVTGVDARVRAGLTNVCITATVTAIGDFGIVGKLTTPKAGQALVVTGYAGQAGIRSVFPYLPDDIRKRFRPDFLDRAFGKESDTSAAAAAGVCREALKDGTFAISAVHAAGEGGIFAALWEMTAGSGVGFTADVHKIPVRQEAVEIAQLLGLNPYEIHSGGSLLIAADDGEGLVQKIRGAGVPAETLGSFTDSNSKILNNRGRIRFLDKPQEDLSVDFRYRLRGDE
jgi:hydrogenase expression/formation protein HypE